MTQPPMTQPPTIQPTFHLICGATGAGKTTYALRLQEHIGGLHFSIDEWMVGLFGPDKPASMSIAWMVDRVARCEAQILKLALQSARQGLPALLDLSFLRTESRARFTTSAEQAGLGCALHVLDVPAQTRWQRVEQRNAGKGETYSLQVTRPMFDFIETLWQPPGEAERAAYPVPPAAAA